MECKRIFGEAENLRRLPSKQRKRCGAVVAPRTAGTWMIKNCVQMLLKGRRSMTDNGVFGIVQDGGQVGRKKATVYLGFDAQTNVGTVGAPQEHF